MKIEISAGAEADITDGYRFYERQSIGLGDYFRSCIFVDIESLRAPNTTPKKYESI
jgi:hypothetical protein